jgi:hypothetical protein
LTAVTIEPLDPLVAELRAGRPVSPAVQMSTLMRACKKRGWEFEVAWRWSFERIKWPHDTGHRRGWKEILGEQPFDESPEPCKQRLAWQAAYENHPVHQLHASVALLIAF